MNSAPGWDLRADLGYPLAALWQDVSAHLVFGLGTGIAVGALARPADGP